jgi:hypothetical protein
LFGRIEGGDVERPRRPGHLRRLPLDGQDGVVLGDGDLELALLLGRVLGGGRAAPDLRRDGDRPHE